MGASVAYQKGNSPKIDWSKSGKLVTVTGNGAVGDIQVSVPVTEQLIALAGLAAAGTLIFGENLDDTNYIEIRDATGASNDVIRVGPREPFLFRFGSDVTAPYWIANTAACLVKYGLIPL